MIDTPVYTLENLCFGYGNNQVLKGLDLRLDPGKFYGILGPNGCGKTTLIDLLCGIRQPDAGRLLLKGKEISTYSKHDLARQVALVPQEFDTGFGFRVEEIVLMGRHPHIDRFASPSDTDWAAVEQAMHAIGIMELRERDIARLSGGQKQRAVVARALAQDSEILLLDEATASLDIRYTLQIFDLAHRMVRLEKKTIIAVIHDLNLACGYCDELLFIVDGKLHAIGDVPSTMTSETIAEVYGVEAQVDLNSYNRKPQVSFHYGDKC